MAFAFISGITRDVIYLRGEVAQFGEIGQVYPSASGLPGVYPKSSAA